VELHLHSVICLYELFCTSTALTQLIAQCDHVIDIFLIPYFFPFNSAYFISFKPRTNHDLSHCSLFHAILYTQMVPQAVGKGIKICWITDAENYQMCLVYWDVMHMGLVLIILDINASSRHTNVWNLLAVKLAVNVLSVALLTMFGRRRTVPFPRPTHAQLCYWHLAFVHFFPGTLMFSVFCSAVVHRSQGNAVLQWLGYGLDHPGFESRQKKIVVSSNRPNRPCGSPSLLFIGYWGLLPGRKGMGREVDQPSPSSDGAKNQWSSTSTSSVCHIVYRDTFAYFLKNT
jgi:hypothetical protein